MSLHNNIIGVTISFNCGFLYTTSINRGDIFMLKLDHIAVMYIYPCYKSDFGYLEEHGIYTVQDFIDNFDKLPESMRKTAIEEDKFKSIERALKLLNREDREPEIYSVQQYSDPKLNKVDKYNMGSVLPMFNPLTGLYVTSTFARYYHIVFSCQSPNDFTDIVDVVQRLWLS